MFVWSGNYFFLVISIHVHLNLLIISAFTYLYLSWLHELHLLPPSSPPLHLPLASSVGLLLVSLFFPLLLRRFPAFFICSLLWFAASVNFPSFATPTLFIAAWLVSTFRSSPIFPSSFSGFCRSSSSWYCKLSWFLICYPSSSRDVLSTHLPYSFHFRLRYRPSPDC